MTYSTQELRVFGVAEAVLEFRRWRRRMRVTQAEAAAMAGVCERTLFWAERGRRRPRRLTLQKLSRLLERWRHVQPSIGGLNDNG